jgi:hypothetical protein
MPTIAISSGEVAPLAMPSLIFVDLLSRLSPFFEFGQSTVARGSHGAMGPNEQNFTFSILVRRRQLCFWLYASLYSVNFEVRCADDLVKARDCLVDCVGEAAMHLASVTTMQDGSTDESTPDIASHILFLPGLTFDFHLFASEIQRGRLFEDASDT